MSGRSGTRGFTLAELLAVIALVAILAAVVFSIHPPSHRDRMRGVTCQVNLKQLALAAAMYTQDWNGHYPPAGLACLDPTQPDGSPRCRNGALYRRAQRVGYGETWQGGGLTVLDDYAKNPGLFWCPSRPDDTPPSSDPKSYYNGFEWLKSPERVRYPAQKVLLLDAYSYHDGQAKVRFDDPPNPDARFHVAFVDGHVKTVRLSTGCSGSPHPDCAGWMSSLGPGGNGHYISSGYGKGAEAKDFP